MSRDLVRRSSTSVFAHLSAALLSAVLIEGVLYAVQSATEAGLPVSARETLFGLTFSSCLLVAVVVLLTRAGLTYGRLGRATTLLVLFATGLWGIQLVTQSVLSGAWIKQQGFVAWLSWGAPPLSAALTVLGLFLFLMWQPRRRSVSALRTLLTLASGVLLAWLNVWLYPGQYAHLHRAVILLSGLLCVLPLSEWLLPLSHRVLHTPRRALTASLAFVLAASGFLVRALQPNDTVTSALLLGSERAGYMLPWLTKSRPSTEIYVQLANLDMKVAKGEAAADNSEWTLPADTNVVLIVVDTLRADTLPPARDQRKKPRFTQQDAPFLSSLVARSYRFERAYGAGTMTRISMPSLFRSREAFEESTSSGEPLAVRMSGLGLYPVAVVGQHFIEPTDERMAGLLEGFAEIEVYPEARQNLENPLIKALLERVRDRPFFAWLHYYATHYEGFAGQRLPSSASAWPRNYPRTVRWVDGQLRGLMAMLDKLDLTRRTLIVFTSDHGEGLMDTGQMWHGDSLLDEAVRVPLFFLVPGRSGALLEHTVGNIDIVPTILALLGKQSPDELRGRSLVPLFQEPSSTWDESYYIEADKDRRVALVHGTDKHIFDRATRLHMHFDLERDPSEDVNVFDPLRAAHRRTLGKLVELRPELFREGLVDSKTQTLLDQRLREVDPDNLPSSLDFLLELVRLAPSAPRLAAFERVMKSQRDERLAAKIIEKLSEKDPGRFNLLLENALRDAERSHTLHRWIDALSRVELSASTHLVVRPYLSRAAVDPRQSPRSWFALVAKGAFAKREEVSALVAMLGRVAHAPQPDPVALRLGLIAVSQSKAHTPAEVARLTDLILPLLQDTHANVEAAACRALGVFRDPRAIEPLKQRLYGKPFVVRLGAMHGLAALIGSAVEADLLKIGREPGYTLNAVVLLERVGTTKALSFLDWVANHGERPFTMKKARQVRRLIAERAAVANE
jgi:hypothetical protein